MPISWEKREELTRKKQLKESLKSELKTAHPDYKKVEQLLREGADPCDEGRPMLIAVKKADFPAMRLLIEWGALQLPVSKSYLGSVCDFKAYKDEMEPQFFEVLSFAEETAGFSPEYYIPYINKCALENKLDKLLELKDAKDFSNKFICGGIIINIIFEMIERGAYETLEYVTRFNDWLTRESLDRAVSGGEIMALAFMLEHGMKPDPSELAVSKAIFKGFIPILDLLVNCGFSLGKNPVYLANACRAVPSVGFEPLEFLLKHGYCLSDKYMGRSIAENARIEKNQQLLDYLAEIEGSETEPALRANA